MSSFKTKIIAIDGPAGAGKSVVSSRLAEVLGWRYVNTGDLYRAIAYVAKQMGVTDFTEDNLSPIIDDIINGLYWNCDSNTVWYKNKDLSSYIKGTEAGQDASRISKLHIVRSKLLEVQRRLALSSNKGAILEGRDIGTVVFPDADLKIFLSASVETRAQRRFYQLKELAVLDSYTTLKDIENDLRRRDDADSKRALAPLQKANDSIEVDTTNLDLDQTISKILDILKEKNLFV